MWQEPQEVPIRKGGSMEASASLLTRLSDSMPVTLSILRLKPDQLALPPFTAAQRAASKRGLGNLRMPRRRSRCRS
jgi:hypothetical protein